jgi:AcrR family transcriptional regulator
VTAIGFTFLCGLLCAGDTVYHRVDTPYHNPDTVYRFLMAPSTESAAQKRPLSLDAIIGASVRIADAEGLNGVSIRRVAAAIAARPMSLYSFIESKDDLVARMLDSVIGDILVEKLPHDWRTAVESIARRTIEVGAKHPWIIEATAQSNSAGPNALAHEQQTLDALASLGADSARTRSLAMAIDVYTIGFAMVSGGASGAPSDDRVFTDGLTWLLNGFEHEQDRRS